MMHEEKRKVYAVVRHNGSLCLLRQLGIAAQEPQYAAAVRIVVSFLH